MNNYYVYRHTAPNSKVYIGITQQNPEKRWKGGYGYRNNPHFFNAIEKYGWDNFRHEILHSDLSRVEAGEEEKRLILRHKSHLPAYGYNHSLGGEFGVKHTRETRKKISDKARFRYSSPEQREQARLHRLGKTHTAETKAKLRAMKLGKSQPITEETKRKISEANKRRYNNLPNKDEICRQCRERGMRAAKQVSCLSMDGTIIATYASTREAERATGVRSGNISRCCNNKMRSSGGFRWQYAG